MLESQSQPQFKESSIRGEAEPGPNSVSDRTRASASSHSFLPPVKRLVPKCWPENLLKTRQDSKGLMRTDNKEFKNLFARFVDFEVCYLHAVGVSSLEGSGEVLQSSDGDEDEYSLSDDTFDQSHSLLSPPQTPELENDELNESASRKQAAKENAVPRSAEVTMKYKHSNSTTPNINRTRYQPVLPPSDRTNPYRLPHSQSSASLPNLSRVSVPTQKSSNILATKFASNMNLRNRSDAVKNRASTPAMESKAATSIKILDRRGQETVPVIIPSPVKPINQQRASHTGPIPQQRGPVIAQPQRISTPAAPVKAKQPVKILTTRKPAAVSTPASVNQSIACHTMGHRLCIACGIDESPCWRPSWNPKKGQLCNSCGLRYRKNHYYCSNPDCVTVPSKIELNSIRGKCKPNDLRCLNCGHHLIRT